jgi:integrase
LFCRRWKLSTCPCPNRCQKPISKTVRFCKLARVERVTPHRLRGSGATQAVRSGEAIEKVAHDIGHADKGVTLKNHYLGGGAIESGHARYIERLVTRRPGIVPKPDDPGSN